MSSLVIWPNTIYKNNELINNVNRIYLVEHPIFFTAYNYHKMKLVLHRASMKCYQFYLKDKYPEHTIIYVPFYKYKKLNKVIFYNPNEHVIYQEYKMAGYDSPSFLMSSEDMETYYNKHKNKNQRHVHFYNYRSDLAIHQRCTLRITSSKYSLCRYLHSPCHGIHHMPTTMLY